MSTLSITMAASGERINYLSLALQARSAIKRLKLLAAGSTPPAELLSALKAAIDSLEVPSGHGELCSKLYDEAGFNRFEEVQTVEEVIADLDESRLSDEMNRLITGCGTQEDIRAAIRFFSALENRALYHYDDPSLAETFR